MNKGKERENYQPAESGENQIVRFDLSQNEEILTEEQREYIIGKFPKKIQDFLRKVKNPLDEKEVIINMFKDKNVRIVIKYEKDFMDDFDWIPYFHCPDLAKVIKYQEKNIYQWNSRWKYNLISFENLIKNENNGKNELLPQIAGATQFMNFDENRTDKNALFIGLDDLKDVLLKINTNLSKEYKKWVMKQSSIMSKFLKYAIKIKNEYENEQLKMQIEKKDKIIEQIEDNKQKEIEEMKQRVEKAIDIYPIYPKQKGYIYIACSEFLKSKGLVRIGRTLNVEKRENQYKCSDPTYYIEYYRDVEDKVLTEKALHYILDNIRKYSNREFFYCSSLEKMKEILEKNIDMIEEATSEQEKIIKEIRNKYIKEEITELVEEKGEENIKINRGRSRTPIGRETIHIINDPIIEFKDKYIEKTEKEYDYIKWTILKKKYEEWYRMKYKMNIPKNIKEEIENKIFNEIKEKPIRINDKTIRGWNKYKIINEYNCDIIGSDEE